VLRFGDVLGSVKEKATDMSDLADSLDSRPLDSRHDTDAMQRRHPMCFKFEAVPEGVYAITTATI
jgi:hypothetical protein